MNNGVNPNNNNLNGEVLGNVENSNNVNNIPLNNEPETLETLDVVMPNDQINPTPNNFGLNNSVESNLNEQNVVSNDINNVNMEQQSIMPEPAYTNPQSINPMPGFESPGTIGTTPPISLEPEKQPKKKKEKNKTLFVILIVLVLFGVGFGTYYILKYTDFLNNNPKVVITTKNLDVNLGEELSNNINYFATVAGTDIKNCNLNVDKVKIDEVGSYSYTITCGEILKNGTINVVDNTELAVETQKIYKVKGDTVDVKEFIINPDDTLLYEFVDETEATKVASDVGTYKVQIKVTSGEKVTEVESELIVLEHKIRGYIICKSKEQILKGSSTTKVVEERLAIADDGKNSFGKVANELYTFKFVDETEYTNYLAKYKTDGTITIDEISGTTKFDDTTLTVTIYNDITSEEVISEYGENNITNYATMKSYFEKNLGYTCSYKAGNV